jgi:hypothetical protein
MITDKWIGQYNAGNKTVEVKFSKCHRQKDTQVSFVQSGTGLRSVQGDTVVKVATTAAFQEYVTYATKEEFDADYQRHRATEQDVLDIMSNRKGKPAPKSVPYPIYGWVFNNIVPLPEPYYHFKVGRAGVEPSVANKVSFLDSESVSNQFKYVRKGWSPEESDILSSYHLITVTERFDESLLVLCKSLNVSMVDAPYLKSKESGKAGTGEADFGTTMVSHVPLTQEPNEVQKAAARLHDGPGNTPDNLLLKFANSALDRHVANYGNTFTLDLQQFRRMLVTVETTCRSHFSESCLWNDNGCGQACIDSLAMQEGWS